MWRKVFEQPSDLAVLIWRRLFAESVTNYDELYDCDKDAVKAASVAKSVVGIWKQAQFIAQANGLKFVGVLQPVAYSSASDVSQLQFTRHDFAKSRQFSAVYPLLIQYAKSEDLVFFDYSEIYDHCVDCFIDWAHTSPTGTDIMASRLSEDFISAFHN